MEETLETGYLQIIELSSEQFEALTDMLSTSITVNVVGFVVLCIVGGILLGQTLWRWMR